MKLPPSRIARPCRVAGLILLAGLAGCGGGSGGAPVVKVYEAKGKVTLADGKPLAGGRIYFVPTAGDSLMRSEAKLATDGSFSLVTGPSGEGAPAGDYKVFVEPLDPSLLTKKKGGKALPFPEKYTDPDKSGLVATLKAEPNAIAPFVLK